MTNDDLLTVGEAALQLGVSPETIYKAVREHRLPAQRTGRALRLRPEDVAQYVVRPWAPVPAGTRRSSSAA